MAPLRDTRARQTRLRFTPLPSSSPAAKGYNKQIQERAAAVSLDSSPGPAKRRRTRSDDVPQMDGSNESMPTPAASAPRPGVVSAESSESDGEPVRSTQRRFSTQDKVTSKSRSKQQRLDFSSARDADSFSSPLKLSSPSRAQSSRAGIFGTQRQRTVVPISSGDESDDLPSPGKLIMEQKKSKKSGAMRIRSAPVTRSTRPVTVNSESEDDNIVVRREPVERIELESEDEDDAMPTTAGMQKRKRARRGSHNSFISSSPPRAIDSDDDIEIIEAPRKRTRRHESDEESELETPRRKLKRSRRSLQREKDDLAEDVDFLGPSSDVEDSARIPRNTQTAAKSAKQQALEKLKRKRSGFAADLPDVEEVEEVEKVEEERDDMDQDDEYDYNVGSTNGGVSKPTSSARMFNQDEYDEDFIEEDDEDTLGVPEDIPIEFTRYAAMKPKELFKYAIEWMVHKKINPAFEMKDGLYDLAFKKLDTEVRGLAGSKFLSAAWTPQFTIALKSRPNIAFERIDRNSAEHWLRDSCDACNRSGHPATWQIQFQGKPYNHQTLDELNNGEDDDDDSTDDSGSEDAADQPDWDAGGQEIQPENTIYYVGKFCKSNAETGHALNHWRFHLNDWVVEWLDTQGYTADAQVVRRDKLSTKKRRKEANKITDRMEQEGVIKTLWKDFYNNIDEARNSKQGRYRADSP